MCVAIFNSVDLVQDINGAVHNNSKLVHDTLSAAILRRKEYHSRLVLTVKRETRTETFKRALRNVVWYPYQGYVPPVISTPGKYFLQLLILREINFSIP